MTHLLHCRPRWVLRTGVPHFGSYSAATGVQTIVWGLGDATVPMPADCQRVYLTSATMGMDAYKIAVATLLLARATHRPVRFYARAMAVAVRTMCS